MKLQGNRNERCAEAARGKREAKKLNAANAQEGREADREAPGFLSKGTCIFTNPLTYVKSLLLSFFFFFF